RPRGDEVDELAEEGLLAVLGVVLRAELARRDDEPCGADAEAAALEAAEDLAGELALDRVGLGEDESALDGHAVAELTWQPPAVATLRRAGRARLSAAPRTRRAQLHRVLVGDDRRLAVRAHLPRRLERPGAGRARRPQPGRAH